MQEMMWGVHGRIKKGGPVVKGGGGPENFPGIPPERFRNFVLGIWSPWSSWKPEEGSLLHFLILIMERIYTEVCRYYFTESEKGSKGHLVLPCIRQSQSTLPPTPQSACTHLLHQRPFGKPRAHSRRTASCFMFPKWKIRNPRGGWAEMGFNGENNFPTPPPPAVRSSLLSPAD